MRLADVIGTVTLARCHPTLRGFRLLLARPLGRSELIEQKAILGEELVIYDDLGAGSGSRIAFAESGEAAAPFYPDKKPIDAYCAALIDVLHVVNNK
jgi:ethanolamine utilization protein EutN